MRNIQKISALLMIPLLASLGIVILFYPGFMSYDSLYALRSAINGITDSVWPPMVSYVWRIVGLISYHPSAMHFSQVFLLLFSVLFVLFVYTKKIVYATICLFIYLFIPVVLGTVAVIWKDVLTAAFLLAGFGLIEVMKLITNKRILVFLSLLTVFMLFIGVCSRHNAITGAVPIIFYLALTICSRIIASKHLWLSVILLGSILTVTIFSSKIYLDNYSLPSFTKINRQPADLLSTVKILDIAGASLCVGSNLFSSDIVANLSLEDIRNGYEPKHATLSTFLNKIGIVDSKAIHKLWLDVAIQHPICIFNNKIQLAKYLMGANQGPQFAITAPAIEENEYGYSLPASTFRDSVVVYIVESSNIFLLRPWFLYLITIISFFAMLRIKALTFGSLTLLLSGSLYFLGLALFGNAADARLLFYTTTTLTMFSFISIFEFGKVILSNVKKIESYAK